MIVYKNYLTFIVLGKEINIISEDHESSYNTVAEIDEQYHYLGNESPTISSAIFAWQEVNGRALTDDELHQVMVDNHLIQNQE